MTQARSIAKRSLAGGVAPLPGMICEAAPAAADAIVPPGLDDATTDYVLAMREPFDLLRQSISQLAGLMILAAAGTKAGIPEPVLMRAVEAGAEARDAIRAARVPPRAAHHHRHLLQASRGLDAALRGTDRGTRCWDAPALDAVLVPLRAAHSELQNAVGALPGFETVALAQACCARPAASRPSTAMP